ncbi:MAG: OsmC family protein [Flavobacteriales bacterium]|nr:OsmC family protein [Flavobacteriales bacterium]NNK80610.1 OsmC family protein [Flavobacteriales bacterium]
MATSRITYTGNLRTSNEHLRSGSVIRTDAPTDNNGLGEDFSPTDLTATSLGACMLTVMGIKAKSENWELVDVSCEVTKVMTDSPRRISEIHIEIKMPPSLKDGQRKSLERVALACPVAKSLSAEIEQVVRFDYP